MKKFNFNPHSTEDFLFKSVTPIEYKHERGEDFSMIEGKLVRISGGRAYLKGLYCNFNISVKDLLSKNVCKNTRYFEVNSK